MRRPRSGASTSRRGALQSCDQQQKQRDAQMTQLENMLQRTPTLGHGVMQDVGGTPPAMQTTFGQQAYPGANPAAPGTPGASASAPFAMPGVGPATAQPFTPGPVSAAAEGFHPLGSAPVAAQAAAQQPPAGFGGGFSTSAFNPAPFSGGGAAFSGGGAPYSGGAPFSSGGAAPFSGG